MDAQRPFWNEEMETLSADRRRSLQEARLLARLPAAWAGSSLLQREWKAAGAHPGDVRSLDDFRRAAPTIHKEMVRQFRDDTGDPYGGMSLLAPDVPCDVHTSSGTTGAPTFLPITERDRSVFAESLARHLWAAGLRPGGVASLSFALYLRPVWPMADAARRIGARVTFTDWPDLPRVVQTFRYLKPDVHAFLSPPQALGLRDEIARLGLDPKEVLGATRGFVWAGDALTPKGRRLVDEEWGSEAFELSGTGDLCFMMQECGCHDGLHMHDDLWFVEVVEPGTTTPVEEGERGEFLFTSLMDESLAFIRWRSEDIGTAVTGRCACGRTNTRLRFLGRVGYRVRVKGRTVFPVEVQRVLEQWKEVDHGLFQIVRTGPDMDTLRLRVGTREGEMADPEGLRPRIEQGLEAALRLPARVEYVDAAMLLALGPPHKIPRIHEAG